RVCTTFVEDASSKGTCQCGAEQELHGAIATRDYFSSAMVCQWDSALHTSEYPTDAFGELKFAGTGHRHSHFIRLSCDTPSKIIYDLMTSDWGLSAPNLVLSVVGGGREKVKGWVREVLRQGLVRAAQSTGAWIMTSGLSEGVGRCVGEAVRDHRAAASSPSHSKVVTLGVAPWGLVCNRQQLVNPKGSFPARYYVQNTSQDSLYLDKNYQGFLLVDDGSVNRRGGEMRFLTNLEDYISHQRTGIWVNYNTQLGHVSLTFHLQRMDASLKKVTPWLVMDGSGPAADLITELLSDLNSTSPPVHGEGSNTRESSKAELGDRVREMIKRHFPFEKTVEELVDQALSIYQNRALITVFYDDQDGPDDFDTVILKALVKGKLIDTIFCVSSSAREYTEELKLAVAWNRVDIANSELFNGDIQWKYNDLEESMTDALVNNKPQFVRIFTENGLNILDYLTFERLESLYQSLPDTLVYTQLQTYLSERKSPSTSHPNSNQSPGSKSRIPLLGSSSGHGVSLFEVRAGEEHVTKLLQGECAYRYQKCTYPWTSLFIWAVLQNRSEMAIFFWEMAEESVLSALGACKILRELSKLEDEAETKQSMKDLAQKFENLAHDVFSACYQSSEESAFTLLIRTSQRWGGVTCLQMAVEADARHFFSHDGVQNLLSRIWWGDMSSRTEVWRLVMSFFLPPLIYTNLITFRLGTFSFSSVLSSPFPPCPKLFSPLQSHSDESDHVIPKYPFILHRWRQFWFAPVTSFLGNVLMYFLFLFLFSYTLLVEFKPPPPNGPAPIEYVLYFWVFTLVCEEIRQSYNVGGTSFSQSMKLYISDWWNKCDLTAIILFCLGLICRMFPGSYEFGRPVLCVDYMVFALRLIHIFAVHKQLGPKIIIVGKMVKDVFFFLFFLGVWLMAYGVANQALLYSYDPRPYWVFRRVFYRPYLHIYGQIPLDELDGEKTCTNNVSLIQQGAEPCPQSEANWLVLILLSIYLLVTNVLLLNLLIAMFSYTFNKVQENSDVYWKFQRYNLIVEYHSRPCLAPPLIIISHLHLFIKRIILKKPSLKIKHFMLELHDMKASRLNTWESLQKENLLSTRSKKLRDSDTERLKRTSTKLVLPYSWNNTLLFSQLEYCSSSLCWIMEGLTQSNMIKSTHPRPAHRGAIFYLSLRK
uniref:Transient receptor potential cation channel, subfamily M, member 4a n=1 Tax=Electrophorus electricus TaxID=8005 RepID=A0AAY5F5E7_ELEEL